MHKIKNKKVQNKTNVLNEEYIMITDIQEKQKNKKYGDMSQKKLQNINKNEDETVTEDI